MALRINCYQVLERAWHILATQTTQQKLEPELESFPSLFLLREYRKYKRL